MRRMLSAVAGACLVFSAAAAQDQDHHDYGKPRGTEHSGPTGNAPGPRGGMRGREMHRGGPQMRGDGGNDTHREMHGNAMMSTHRTYDVHGYQRAFNAPHRYHMGAWHPPHGYTYRHWSYGERLPRLYFERDYWIPNFTIYGLMAPPPDAVWVRYGPDALLVDEDSGEIIQVEYGVFY